MTYGHLLIGPPGSGKSTFACILRQALADATVISTDAIRAELYGDAGIQGRWAEVEAAVLQQMVAARALGKTIVYDATNARRSHRLALLLLLAEQLPGIEWIGWQLQTPLETCLRWNQRRTRQVPEAVIERMTRDLAEWGPIAGEGMALVVPVTPEQTPDLETWVAEQLQRLPRRISQRRNRTRAALAISHRYSYLLDFERLLYLIALLAHHPGLGSLQQQQPDQLAALLGAEVPAFTNPAAEIAAVMAARVDPVYASEGAIAEDLAWLEQEGFLQPQTVTAPLQIPPLSARKQPLEAHPWSDIDTFSRVLGTIRWLAQHPLVQPDVKHRTAYLSEQLQLAGILRPDPQSRDPQRAAQDLLRKDIERVLHPYGLLAAESRYRGYYLGTALLTQPEMLVLHNCLHSHSENLQDPLLQPLLTRLTRQLQSTEGELEGIYPVQAISHEPICDPRLLPPDCLAHPQQLFRLEQAILSGELLVLKQYRDAARFDAAPGLREALGELRIWPLQIVFHSIGWYLGYEVAMGSQRGLLAYQRLDRLFEGCRSQEYRPRTQQLATVERLTQLRRSSGGLLIGHTPQEQAAWLSDDPAERESVSVLVELWFTPRLYQFIAEGSQRFPEAQIRMNRPDWWGRNRILPRGCHLYSLRRQSRHPTHPYRLQLTLPRWALESIDFRRWVIGFGGDALVQQPPELREVVLTHSRTCLGTYEGWSF